MGDVRTCPSKLDETGRPAYTGLLFELQGVMSGDVVMDQGSDLWYDSEFTNVV